MKGKPIRAFMDSIIWGDCIDVMGQMPEACIDLTITSPPYDNLRNYGEIEFNFEGIAEQLWRVTCQRGVVVWVVADATIGGSETCTSMRQALQFCDLGFRLHDTMIYYKDNPVPVGGKNRYYQSWEYMFVFSKGTPNTFNPITRERRNKWNDQRTSRVRGMTRNVDGEFEKKVVSQEGEVKIGNVWRYVVSGGSSASSKLAHKHPAIFPEKLVADHIKSWTNPRDVVLDPMVGSGTTVKVAQKMGRRFIGIDKVEEYVNIARERLTGEDDYSIDLESPPA